MAGLDTVVQHACKIRPYTAGTTRILYLVTCSCGWEHPHLADSEDLAREMHAGHQNAPETEISGAL